MARWELATMEKLQPLTQLDEHFTRLPRGGYLVNTSEGYIQFGSPPETVKDTMLLPNGVPSIFVLPYEHFDPAMGISMGEIEFPTYYNFYLKKRKNTVYVFKEQIACLRMVFKEAFEGPERVDVRNEVELGDGAHIPDIKAEMDYFRNGATIDDLLDIREIDPKGVTMGNVRITTRDDNGFDVYDNNVLIAEVPGIMKSNVFFDLGTTLQEPFIPPDFGVTCLGPSHGFDPTQNTSGFILWLNKTGIMVDPPVNSTQWLKESNVNPKLIDAVILTHCHADHDAGTFQKILEEGKVRVYTTPTVMQSFLKKYSALTRISAATLITMFDFEPVKCNAPYNINGASFTFYYSVHSIPTIAFYFLYRDKTFLYSSDHKADPMTLRELYDRGIMSKERLEFFLTVPWDMDIIYHEAGIPPLHTKVDYLNSLPEDIQKKITVYHIAEKQFPKEDETHLRLAKFGIGETLYPEITKHKYEDAYHILDVFSRIDIFQALPFERIKYLLFSVKEEHFERGDYIIEKDTPGDKFYVIESGNVTIGGLENVDDKVYGTYEYFGEASLLMGTFRAADVIAATNVRAYSIDKIAFLRIIKGTRVEDMIRRVARIRTGETWNAIKANKYFKTLSSSQITQIEAIMTPYTAQENTMLIEEGEKGHDVFLLGKGDVDEYLNGKVMRRCSQGDLLGAIFRKQRDDADATFSEYGYKIVSEALLYKIPEEDFIIFLNENPGVFMQMIFKDKKANGMPDRTCDMTSLS